MYRGWR